jgi:hypothetical protein
MERGVSGISYGRIPRSGSIDVGLELQFDDS